MSIPSFNRLYNPYMSITQTRFNTLAVNFKDPKNKVVV